MYPCNLAGPNNLGEINKSNATFMWSKSSYIASVNKQHLISGGIKSALSARNPEKQTKLTSRASCVLASAV